MRPCFCVMAPVGAIRHPGDLAASLLWAANFTCSQLLPSTNTLTSKQALDIFIFAAHVIEIILSAIMDDDITSAVDDSGATQVFGHPPPAPRSEANGPIDFEYGRRSGHWTAGDTVFGSGIDDQCATIIQPPRRHGANGKPGLVHALSKPALCKLKWTAEENEKKRAAEQAAQKAQERGDVIAAAGPAKAACEAKAAPKGFYVPKRGGLGIRIVGRDGKTAVVVKPQSVALNAQPSKSKAQQSKAATPEPTPEAPAKASTKIALVTSRAASSVRQRVRIVSKNGEEAFVDLPAFNAGAKSASHVHVATSAKGEKSGKETSQTAGAKQAGSKEHKAEQDQKATTAASEMRAERERQEKEAKAEKDQKAADTARELRTLRQKLKRKDEERKERQEKAVADFTMAGGLGGSRTSSPAAQTTSTHTRKTGSSRSPTIVNGRFDGASEAPTRASSRTMTPPSAQSASVRAASRTASQRTKTAMSAGWQPTSDEQAASQKLANSNPWEGDAGAIPSGDSVPWPSVAKSTSQAPRPSSKAAPSQQGWQALGNRIEWPSQTTGNDSWKGQSAVYKPTSAAPPAPYTPSPQIPAPSLQQRRKASTPSSRALSITSSQISRKIAGIHSWNKATPDVHSRVPSHVSQPNSTHGPTPTPAPLDIRRANNTSQDTIYAGTGWISPHPLSVAPSDFELPPQDQISIQGATLTYSEYRRLQVQTSFGDGLERRNFSRTSSGAESFRAGQWGGRANVPASLGGDAVEAGGGWSAGYHVPTVVSEHSQREKSHASFWDNAAPRDASATSDSASGANTTARSFSDSPPRIGEWGLPPQVDGTRSYGTGLGVGQTWREPGRDESPVVLRNFASGDGAEQGTGSGRVQLRMPWDGDGGGRSGTGKDW